jgi:hypothetical protein
MGLVDVLTGLLGFGAQIPGVIGSLRAMEKSDEIFREWQKKTDPAKYFQDGWITGNVGTTRVTTDMSDLLKRYAAPRGQQRAPKPNAPVETMDDRRRAFQMGSDQ